MKINEKSFVKVEGQNIKVFVKVQNDNIRVATMKNTGLERLKEIVENAKDWREVVCKY